MRSVSKTGRELRKGAWTADEDTLLKNCIEKYGEGKWHLVPLKSGLNRCRKSCRLRWLNYLRPDIKRGDFGEDEVDLMLRLHKLLGNRWSLIAGRIPGRTANDVKNYWNTHLRFHFKKQRKELPKDDDPSQDITFTIFKPRPRTFTKTSNPHTYISSNDDGRNVNDHVVDDTSNVSPGLISPPRVLDEKINEYLDELLDNQEKEVDGGVGWSFGGSPVDGEALEFVQQEDGQSSLFDFPIDDLMWDFLDSEQP